MERLKEGTSKTPGRGVARTREIERLLFNKRRMEWVGKIFAKG